MTWLLADGSFFIYLYTVYFIFVRLLNIAKATNFFDIVPVPYSDLAVTSVSSNSTAQSGQSLTVSWTVANLSNINGGQGIGITSGSSWSDNVYLAS